MKIRKLVLFVACLFLVQACQQSPVRNPFEGRKEAKLGALPAVQAGKMPHMAVAWTNAESGKQEHFLKLTPFITESHIYVADSKGNLAALERTSGKTIWHKKCKQKLLAGPTVNDNLVLVASDKATVIAYEATKGDFLWEAKVPSRIAAKPNTASGVVLVHTIDGTVSALNATSGESLWQVEQSTPALSLHFGSTPVISGQTALVGLSSGKLLALNLQNGNIEWERALTLPRGRSEVQRMVDITADPLVVGEMVYAINYQGKLAALEVGSGELHWEREISSYQNMVASASSLYVTDTDHNLWAIDRHSGVTLWKQDALKTRYITGPAIVDDLIAVADKEGYLHFVSQENGLLMGREKVAGKIIQTPLAFQNTLLVSTQKGKLTALNLNQGQG